MLCHKNCMTTPVITLWLIDVKSLITSLSGMHFLFEMFSILKG